MKKRLFVCSFLFSLCFSLFGQTLPADRVVDWSLAGLRDTNTVGFNIIDMQSAGAVGDGVTSNSNLIHSLIEGSVGQGVILDFPTGNFFFDTTISVTTSNVIIRGAGQENTTFLLDMSALWFKNSEGIKVQGNLLAGLRDLTQPAHKDSSFVFVTDASLYNPGDWVTILFNDSAYVYSDWAEEAVGQVLKIESIIGNQLFFESPLRLSIDINDDPYLRRINMVENVGIECLKVKRIDNTSPEQSNNIEFRHAANCWVSGIESDTANFSHIMIYRSSNIYVGNSYFKNAFEYTGGGRAYGVNLAFSTGECLIENNIFEHLRHSMLVQAGANGNVFAFNYSTDPFWTPANPVLPSDAAGDMVLHGNWPFANLFEQNICQNIVIDNSHAANGPYNTFLRNRSEKFGIFFNDASSPSQNFLGNDISNTTFPYSSFNYIIAGADQFLHGNNNKGTIDPPGTEVLPDISYYYSQRPAFIPVHQWGTIGTPNPFTNPGNLAYDRFVSGNIIGGVCGNPLLDVKDNTIDQHQITVYPNPSNDRFQLIADQLITEVEVYTLTGQRMYQLVANNYEIEINSLNWPAGVYILKVKDNQNRLNIQKIIKSN